MTRAPLRFDTLLRCAGVVADDVPPVAVRAIAVDSRRVAPGDVFVAIRGARHDGVLYAPDAIRRGAVAIVAEVDRPETIADDVPWVRVDDAREAAGPLAREATGRPDEALDVIGVTGTNGKTTVTYLVQSIGRSEGLRVGRLGTNGVAWDDRETTLERTTPEAPEMYGWLRRMADDGCEAVAMEVSSHALALGRVGGLDFRVGAFLNLSRDHLDFHGDLATYFDAKASLFERLSPSSTAVVAIDDPRGPEIVRRTKANVRTFGRSAAADLRIDAERVDASGSSAALRTREETIRIRTPLVGSFHVDNAAAAAACALAAGWSTEAIAHGIASLGAVPGRSESVRLGQPFAVVVDYAHTPDALDRLLEAVGAVIDGRLTVVFGCGGDRDPGKRSEMGAIAARRCDRVVVTSDNPRREDPEAIARAIVAGARSVNRRDASIHVEPDRADAIHVAIANAEPGDAVVIAGKGSETYQVVGDRASPFDDRETARRALRTAGYGGERADA